MANSLEYYRWQAHSYRIEFDFSGKAQGGYVLQPDGAWSSLKWGWQSVINNGTPISEEDAFYLAGIKKRKIFV